MSNADYDAITHTFAFLWGAQPTTHDTACRFLTGATPLEFKADHVLNKPDGMGIAIGKCITGFTQLPDLRRYGVARFAPGKDEGQRGKIVVPNAQRIQPARSLLPLTLRRT